MRVLRINCEKQRGWRYGWRGRKEVVQGVKQKGGLKWKEHRAGNRETLRDEARREND